MSVKYGSALEAAKSRKNLQFARDQSGGFQQFAIKFFLDSKDFGLEEAMYAQPELRKVLPNLIDARAQRDPSSIATAKSRHGYVFPPFLVLERGLSLAECAFQHCLAACNVIW